MPAVLEVCDYHGPYPGNFIPTLLAVGTAVRERLGLGYRCAFPAQMRDRPWVQTVREAGITIDWLDATRPRRERLRALTEIAERADARLLRSHFTAWDLETAVVGRRRGAGVVWNIHTGNLGYGWRQRLSDLVKVRAVGRWCDAVIAVSDGIAEETRRRGFPARKVHTVLNGIDMARFAGAPDRDGARAELGLDPEAQVVLLLGWSPHAKGVDVALAALADLPGVTLLLVGAELLTPALPDPVPTWVRVVAPVQDAGVLYAASDVFLSASRLEAFSYAIGEAMAMRLPVVSSDIPGPAAYFGAPGLRRYPVEDAAALRAAVSATLADPERAELGEANRRYVAERLSLPRHVEGVIATFEAVL